MSQSTNNGQNTPRPPKKRILPWLTEDEERDFGNWFAGLVDGEGHFGVKGSNRSGSGRSCTYRSYNPSLRIGLRDDDLPILKTIQKTLRVGTIHSLIRKKSDSNDRNPLAVFHVGATTQLLKTIIPLFESYPLRAKKRRDFEIWKQGIFLIYGIHKRSRRGSRGRKWTRDDLRQMQKIKDELQSTRQYENAEVRPEPPQPKRIKRHGFLADYD